MKTPLLINGVIIDNNENLQKYIYKLDRQNIYVLKGKSTFALFETKDIKKDFNYIGKSLQYFSTHCITKLPSEKFSLYVYLNGAATLYNLSYATSDFKMNDKKFCEGYCDQRIINELGGQECYCEQSPKKFPQKSVENVFREIHEEADQYILASNLLRYHEYNTPSNTEPLSIFLGLNFAKKDITDKLHRVAKHILKSISGNIDLPYLKNPEHYKNLDLETQYKISHQIHSYDTLIKKFNVLPIVTEVDELELITMTYGRVPRNDHKRLFYGFNIDDYKTHAVTIDKGIGLGVNLYNRLLTKGDLFISKKKVKKYLTIKGVSHYNYLLKVIKRDYKKYLYFDKVK